MRYPDCKTPDACRFVSDGGTSTAMYSPLEYNREGKPVAGGWNGLTRSLSCHHCGRRWIAAGTELEFAQGRVEWTPTPADKEQG